MVSRNTNSNTSSSSNANYNVNANANAYVSASASSSASADLSQARVIEPAHFKSGESSQQKNAEAPQGDCCLIPSPSAPFDRTRNRGSNTVFKSGFLFISSKGLGWTSWKKRWFILTRTSLVFFRSDPSALPQKGGEVNLTLGGIDLNNSGSVVVRADKKLLTVLFPNGGDGRGFTLKAETSEDLYEWKAALENALAQAPSAALVMGQNGIFRNDAAENVEGNVEQWRERRPVKSLVVGRPILLALEDIDGSPSFLEKALRFMEQHGVKVEGILRQAADVEEVELRVQQYEQGKTEFSPDEDAHVVGDCVKHVLRELPSSPVPASCCTALLEAYLGNDRDNRVNAIRDAIAETFPEPNRRLLQRILKMMHVVASQKAENRMTTSAVAACMAPLLLRPLLAGDCELEDDFDHHGDGSAQLLAAAAAANHAHAIVTILLEEYHRIFAEEYLQKDSLSPDEYSESEGSETEELTEEDEEISETADDPQNDDDDLEDDQDRALSGTLSESSGHAGSDLYDYKVFEGMDSDVEAKHRNEVAEINQRKDKESQVALDHATHNSNGCSPIQSDKLTGVFVSDSHGSWSDLPSESPKISSSDINSISCLTKASSKSSGSAPSAPSIKRPTVWGRTPARKNLSMESVDSSSEDELVIQRLEITKNDLQNKIAKEVKGNAILQASLERRKQALHERRQALEQDVARLQEQLQRERDLRATLEAGLNMPPGNYAISSNIDNKARAELEEIALAEADVMNLKQTVADLHLQLNQQRQHGLASVCESCTQHQHSQSQELPRDSTRTQGGAPALSKQAPVKQRPESTNVTDNKPTSASRNLSPDSPYHDRPASIRQPVQEKGSVSTSSQLVELTSRLDFLKERRSHLLSELHNLDANYTGGSQSQMRLPPSKYHSQ